MMNIKNHAGECVVHQQLSLPSPPTRFVYHKIKCTPDSLLMFTARNN